MTLSRSLLECTSFLTLQACNGSFKSNHMIFSWGFGAVFNVRDLGQKFLSMFVTDVLLTSKYICDRLLHGDSTESRNVCMMNWFLILCKALVKVHSTDWVITQDVVPSNLWQGEQPPQNIPKTIKRERERERNSYHICICVWKQLPVDSQERNSIRYRRFRTFTFVISMIVVLSSSEQAPPTYRSSKNSSLNAPHDNNTVYWIVTIMLIYTAASKKIWTMLQPF